MFGSSSRPLAHSHALIVDVGSASVGLVIIPAAVTTEEKTQPVWLHREWVRAQPDASLLERNKALITALVNAFLALDSTGIQTLRDHNTKARIETMSVAISAPWSYTVTKSVQHTAEEPFPVTKDVIRHLTEEASQQSLTLISEQKTLDTIGLEVIEDVSRGYFLNGYPINNPLGHEAQSITVLQTVAVVEHSLLAAVREMHEKTVPKATLSVQTFMNTFATATQDWWPQQKNTTLIDITAEATEIGVVQDGILRYVTHIPQGTHSLMRALSTQCEVPVADSRNYIRNNHVDPFSKLNDCKKKDVTGIIEQYEARLQEAFTTIGGMMPVPKHTYLHAERDTEAFFRARVETAGENATHTKHNVQSITSTLFPESAVSDTAILFSMHVFHKKQQGDESITT